MELPGSIEFAERILEARVRIGFPSGINNLVEEQFSSNNINKIRKIRKKNWLTANKILKKSSLGIFKSTNIDTYFSYLIFIKNRDGIIKLLRKNDIYCPIYWKLNNKLPKNSFSRFCSEKMISVPIDQRYSYKKIRYISNIIKNCLQY